MQHEEEGGGVERMFRDPDGVPGPGPDLTARTLDRVRYWILIDDLLRLVTIEALWARLPAGSRGADLARRRQHP